MQTINLGYTRVQAKGLSIDSRNVREGDCFLACASTDKQNASHGIAYADQAIRQGASAIIWEPTDKLQQMPVMVELAATETQPARKIPLYRLENLSARVGHLAAEFYGMPSLAMHCYGITGTNGKTSVSFYIAQLFQLLNEKAAVTGTLGYGQLHQLEVTHHTTPDAVSLQQILSQLKQQQCRHAAMEVSSHALSQHRVKGVSFKAAVFTNLSRDHLDYHGDMENYEQSKFSLFTQKDIPLHVINADDPVGLKWLNDNRRIVCNTIAYSLYADDVKDKLSPDISLLSAQNREYNAQGCRFELAYQGKQYPVEAALTGHFNISNVLAASAVLVGQGKTLEEITVNIPKLEPVKGRMQLLQSHKTAQVIIDYAHTPDALEQALTACRRHTTNKLWCVFGCGGNRDKGKRSLMGEIAAKLADHIMLTSDNPRDEDPQSIIDDIARGAAQKTVLQEVDRESAIQQVIRQADRGDIILVAGKGHEDYQEIKGKRYPMSDQQLCLAAMS